MTAARAAIYCRVSTDEQAERGTSLADQRSRCEAYCREQAWKVTHVYVDDGVSGATTDRPELTRLVAAAERRELDRIVVTDPDRLSRDLVDGLSLERDLARFEVEVTYLVQPTMGTLERQIRGVIAEEERRKIRERTSRGLRAVAAAGHWPGGPPPYGYQIEKTDAGRSDLAINRREAEVLTRMIDALVDRRLTTWQLAAELNTDNIPTASKGRRLSNGGSPRWTHRRVRDVLTSAKGIAGQWVYTTAAGTFTLQIPAIVTEQRLDQLRERLAESSTGRNATAKKHPFALARRVISECGNPMHGYARPDGTGRVYRCSMSTADRGPDRCECKRSSADAIENAAWELVAHELTDPLRLQRLAGLAASLPDSDTPRTDDLRTLDRKIKRLESAIGSQIADLLASGLDSDAVRVASQELQRRLESLRRQRTQAVRWASARADRAAQVDRIAQFAQSARTALANPTPELKAHVIDLLDIRVTIVGHTPCTTCNGRGLLASADGSQEDRRTQTGSICPACRRFRSLPTIELAGLLPSTDHLLQGNPDPAGLPFTLRSIA